MRRRKGFLILPPVLFFLLEFSTPVIVQAGVVVEANILSVLDLDKTPIDIFTDGRWAFVLTPGEVQVYAVNTRALSGRIPVEKAVSRISASSGGNKLYLLNEKTNTLSTYRVAFFNMFTIAGSPFKGPADAPVVITDFSDYQ